MDKVKKKKRFDDNDKILDEIDQCKVWKRKSGIDTWTNYDKIWRNKISSCLCPSRNKNLD